MGYGLWLAFLGGLSHTRFSRRIGSGGYSVSPRMSDDRVTLIARRCSNIKLLVISIAFRLSLSPRLTLIRLTLIRNPEFFGEEVSHLLYRYLCLHLLFQPLHGGSRLPIHRCWNAPLPIIFRQSHSFGSMLMPDHYPCPAARLVSCYALFK